MRNCGFIASFLCALAIFAVSAVIAFGALDGATPGGGGMLALHNPGCRSGLNPPASSSDLAM